MYRKEKYGFALLFLSVTMVYLAGAIMIDIMDIDASLYAEMSREMFRSGNPFIFLNREIDLYLDKPPLVFWSAVASYAVFGVNHFAYRLPTILSTILGAYSVYGFTRLYYGKEQGLTAAALLVTCQAWFLINHDVRTDTLLANFVMFGTWQLALWLRSGRIMNFILSFIGFGFAVLAKGPIGLMAPVVAFSAEFIYKRRYKLFLKPIWLAGVLILLVVITPMLYSLFLQYGPYGIEFTLWTQSFGRIIGQNYWSDSSGPFFFVHTFLWSYLPWSVPALFALIDHAAGIIRKRRHPDNVPEIISISGFAITFIILSFSSYKLPHYIYVVFPYISVFTGAYLVKVMQHENKWRRSLAVIQPVITAILLLAITVLAVFFFPPENWLVIVVIMATITAVLMVWIKGRGKTGLIFWLSAAGIIGVNLLLNTHVYPSLLEYQPGKKIASYVDSNDIDRQNIFLYNLHSSAMDFYMDATPPEINLRKAVRMAEARSMIWIITDRAGLDRVRSVIGTGASIESIFDHYRVQILTFPFINPATRTQVTGNWYLMKVTPAS